MSEPVKCPRCEDAALYERSIAHHYSRIVRLPDGTIDYDEETSSGDYETDCWTCLNCGVVLDWADQKAIYEGGDA